MRAARKSRLYSLYGYANQITHEKKNTFIQILVQTKNSKKFGILKNGLIPALTFLHFALI